MENNKEYAHNSLGEVLGFQNADASISPVGENDQHTVVEALAESLIKSINVNDSNFKHIASTGIINGTLKIELQRVLKEMHTAALSKKEGWVSKLTDIQDRLMSLIAYNHVPDAACPEINEMIDEIDQIILSLPEAPKQ